MSTNALSRHVCSPMSPNTSHEKSLKSVPNVKCYRNVAPVKRDGSR